MLGEPRLRDALLCPREPRFDDQVLQLLAVDAREIRDPHQHGRVAVEVRGREVDAALVGEHQVLHVEVGHAEHEHVGEALARLGSTASGRRLRWKQNIFPCTKYDGRPSSETSFVACGSASASSSRSAIVAMAAL